MENEPKKFAGKSEIIIGAALASAAACVLVLLGGYFVLKGRIAPAGSYGSSTPGYAAAFSPSGEEADIIKSVDAANPSVVSIVISKDVPIIQRNYRTVGPFTFSVPQQNGSQQVEIGGGSGFIVSGDGLVVTNKHVVDDPSASYTLFTNDGKKYDVTVLAKDPFYDIAILKIKGGGTFPYLQFSDSDNIKLGQTAIAIGNALAEFRNSVSVGVVSGLSRSLIAGSETGQTEAIDQAIQTDAAINPGNSGGPLLNSNGQVIGVNSAIVEGSSNIGFALPGNIAKTALDSVIKNGTIVRPYLGVRTVTVTPELQTEQKLSVNYGELVAPGDPQTANGAALPAVVPNSPAATAGIKEGDIILKVDGQALDETHTLGQVIRKRSVGDTVFITLTRGGKEMSLQATLEKAPDNL